MVSGVLLDPGRGQPAPVLCASGSATSSMEPLYLLLAMAWLGLSQILASYSRLCFCPSTPCSLAFGASDRMLYPALCFTAPSLVGLIDLLRAISQLHNPCSSFAGQAQIWLSLWHSFHFSTAWLWYFSRQWWGRRILSVGSVQFQVLPPLSRVWFPEV